MKRSYILCFITVVLLSACGKNVPKDWLTSDDVTIAIDETFRPIMEEQLQQFSLTHPLAQMKETYCSEDSALRLLLTDSVRSCIVTRKLTEKEKQIIRGNQLSPSTALIATDAFALIVNKNNPDTLITLAEIKDIVSGKITRWEQLKNSNKTGDLQLLFDHSGSSTVRYMKDSLCGGKDLQGNVYAQGSNPAVIDMVQSNPNVIGVVGVDWLRGNRNKVLNDFSELDVKVMLVRKNEDSYHRRPYQFYIATGEYPLTRSVYVITTDPRPQSQEKYLYHWLKGQKGQLIFCDNSQLLPMSSVQIKAVKIKE